MLSDIALMKKRISVERSPLLYAERLSPDHLAQDWTQHHSQWHVTPDGWLEGRNPGNHAGMAILRRGFPGNVLVSFQGRTVPPCTHDINVMWNGEWRDDTDQRGVAYVAGLQGWWTGKVGIEKSPDYALTAGTPLFPFEPGRTYAVQVGSIDGHCFVVVDGRVLLECTDPNPIDTQRFTRVGFECYCSHIQIRDIEVRQITWEPLELRYEPEF